MLRTVSLFIHRPLWHIDILDHLNGKPVYSQGFTSAYPVATELAFESPIGPNDSIFTIYMNNTIACMHVELRSDQMRVF